MTRGIRSTTLLLSVTVLAVPIGVQADPSGRPFQALQAQIADLQAQVDALSSESVPPISVGYQSVDRDLDVECPGHVGIGGSVLLLSDGSIKRIDTAPFTFASPNAAFGDLALLTDAAWTDVEGIGAINFYPAGCFGPGEPSSDTSIENLNACAVAVDGTLACVNGLFCSGDCGSSPGFTGKPWTFEGDVIP
jgi:hypothetical protein